MFNRSALTLVLALAGGTAAIPVRAQQASTTATATVINPLTLSAVTPLNFGAVVTGGATGSVTVTPSGTRSSSGGVTMGSSAGVTPAEFSVTGQSGSSYSVTLPSSITLTDTAANTMTVDTFTHDLGGSPLLGPMGTQLLHVGATLWVGATQPSGVYTGTFTVTVNY